MAELSDTVKREILGQAFESGLAATMKYSSLAEEAYLALNRHGANLTGSCNIRGFDVEVAGRKFHLLEYADETPNRRCVVFYELGIDKDWVSPRSSLMWRGFLNYNPEEFPGFNDSNIGVEYVRMPLFPETF